ncbi:hypothetical protein ACK36B_04380 [Aeromonas veronii]|uniref:hypothetical protein n=1 Tax=Aeromonas TaxID=642 RepID=UPI001C5B1260|nr:hypothetical protein [Aeromonas veronii]MBW3781614.1 hypothetical protein [Aeromonas veronii]MCV3283954.1 hypothetical protein [Aeromonas veronii]
MTYKKFGFLTAILALSGFYLYTLYLAAHPNVSLAYKLYYLEGKTRFWEHNSSMTYQPGNELNLTKPSRFLSSEGWAKKPSNEGTLLSGQGGLYFVLPKQAANPDQLTVQARINSPEAGALLKVALGHDFTTTVKLAKAGINEIRLSLPGDSLTADPKRPNFLALSAPTPINVQSVRLTVAQ